MPLILRIGIRGEIYKRPYRVRKAAVWGKEVTIAPEAPFCPGEEIVQLFDGFVLIVSKGTVVNELLLRRAITTPKERRRREGEAET